MVYHIPYIILVCIYICIYIVHHNISALNRSWRPQVSDAALPSAVLCAASLHSLLLRGLRSPIPATILVVLLLGINTSSCNVASQSSCIHISPCLWKRNDSGRRLGRNQWSYTMLWTSEYPKRCVSEQEGKFAASSTGLHLSYGTR